MAFLHEHLWLPLSDLLRGEQVHHYLPRLREAEKWNDAQLREFQQGRLHTLFHHLATEVPFYRDWFQEHHLHHQDITLEQLPIVDKNIMRREGIERFAAEHFPPKERITSRSSGSTGEPFTFYESKLSVSVNTAAKLRTWQQAGYHLGNRYLKIANGTRQGRLKRWQDNFANCIYIPFYSIDDTALASLLELIEKKRPLFIRSYPAPRYLLAQYLHRHPDLYHHHPKHIFTTGATLTSVYRQEIEDVFGCDVIDSYSCEGTPNTYETLSHDGYRVTGYYGIVEVLDNNNKPVTDGIGRVVSTDLWNLAHPFVRYDTQDLVEVKGSIIQRIIGRECDAFVHANGTLFTVHNFSHYFLYEINAVDTYQIIKHPDRSITFLLVTNSNYTSDTERHIIDYWQKQLNTSVDIKLVDRIPLMKNNKRLTIVEE